MMPRRIFEVLAGLLLASTLALGSVAIGAAGASEAATTPPPTPSPTTTTSTAPDPYAEHDHVEGDADSDPTWVWVAGGVFVLIIGGGVVGLALASRRSAGRRAG